jgi:aldehyde dehydrogenase (NAD+)
MSIKEASIAVRDILALQKEWFLAGHTFRLRDRKRILLRLRDLLHTHEEEIATAIYNDFGKSRYRVRENELGLVYAEIRRMVRNLSRWNRPLRPHTSLINLPGKSRVYPVPYGNSLVISPWNYPVQLALIPVVSAIAAGNTVILKPSELTGETSGLLAKLINTHLPREVIFVREGGVEETRELLELQFDKIFFTGSTHVGRIVMQAAARHLTPVTLELGGKNPAIVLPDCNLKMTARRVVWGKLHNGGQACVAVDHVYVHRDIHDAFVDCVNQEIDRLLRHGSENGVMPRIINTANFQRLLGLINESKVVKGGGSDPGKLTIEPTVMTGVTEDDDIMKEEIFGPLLPVLGFSALDELMAGLKRKPSPLALYIFTSRIATARKIQKTFRSGGGMINDTVLHFINSTTPFGGMGESGMGNYHGRAGFEAFSHRKSVVKKPTWFELWLKHPPFTAFKLKIVKMFLR